MTYITTTLLTYIIQNAGSVEYIYIYIVYGGCRADEGCEEGCIENDARWIVLYTVVTFIDSRPNVLSFFFNYLLYICQTTIIAAVSFGRIKAVSQSAKSVLIANIYICCKYKCILFGCSVGGKGALLVERIPGIPAKTFFIFLLVSKYI